MDRRTVLRRGAVTTTSILFAGCSGIVRSGGVDLVVRNSDGRDHEYEITAGGDFEERETAEELGPDESNTVSGFIPRLDYTHATTLDVAINGSYSREIDIIIESEQNVIVDIIGSTDVKLRPSEIISPSRETDS